VRTSPPTRSRVWQRAPANRQTLADGERRQSALSRRHATLGCTEGRSADTWIDFDLFGHQIVAHLDPAARAVAVANPVDGHDVPVPHFGVVLTMPDWQALADRLGTAGTRFGIAPHIRFVGQPGEQATMFFYDPSGNALEFKAFADDAMLFAT
jgi:extradiol dioxygenase family protein